MRHSIDGIEQRREHNGLPVDVTALGAEAAQEGGEIASDVVDRDHTLEHMADITAVEDVLAPSQSVRSRMLMAATTTGARRDTSCVIAPM